MHYRRDPFGVGPFSNNIAYYVYTVRTFQGWEYFAILRIPASAYNGCRVNLDLVGHPVSPVPSPGEPFAIIPVNQSLLQRLQTVVGAPTTQ